MNQELLRRILQSIAAVMPGGHLPDRYICLDIETTGFSADKDLIVQTGHCVVKDRKATSYHEHVLNWWQHPNVREDWLEGRLARCKDGMEKNGNRWHGVSTAVMREVGRKPEEVLEQHAQLLLRGRQKSFVFVGQNLINFDAPRLQQAFEEWCGILWTFRESEMIDTAAIEKAIQLEMAPLAGETHYQFARRVMARRAAGVTYKLDDLVTRYRLKEDYDLPQELRHSAGGDCVLCHLYLEKLRVMAGL